MTTQPNPERRRAEEFLRGRTDSELRTLKLAIDDSHAMTNLGESSDFGGLIGVWRDHKELVIAEMGRRPYVGLPTWMVIDWMDRNVQSSQSLGMHDQEALFRAALSLIKENRP